MLARDAYDLVFTLLNHEGGAEAAGRAAAASAVAGHPQVTEALALLEERFRDAGQDGPSADASFLATPDDDEERVRLRQEAVATVQEFLRSGTTRVLPHFSWTSSPRHTGA